MLAFAVQPHMGKTMTATYSYRLQKNFAPHVDYLDDIRQASRPMVVLVGGEDELFYSDKFATVFHAVRSDVPVIVVPGLNHIAMSLAPAAFKEIIAALKG